MKRVALVLMLAIGTLAWADDKDEISNCLSNWKKHPFKTDSPFRIMRSTVKVMGVGGEILDDKKSAQPELILVKPTVNVMSKSLIRLMNPNGWYCLKNNVAVMGKTKIEVDCKAQLTASNPGATVLGKDEGDTGVTVLGKTEVTKVNCAQ